MPARRIIGGADGRVDAVVAGVIGEPEMVGRHLAGDRCAPQLCHLDSLDGAPGGDVAHVQAGLIVLAQPAVPHRLDVLGQPIVPGADLHILGVAHHGDVPLGADGERPGHGGVILHTVACGTAGADASSVSPAFAYTSYTSLSPFAPP